MSSTWAAKVARSQVVALGRLRLLPGVEFGEERDAFWLRGSGPLDEICSLLQTVPHLQLFDVDEDGKLRPLGKLLSDGQLPTVKFVPIQQAIVPQLPIAAFSQAKVAAVPMPLVRGGDEQAASLLLTDLETWSDYAIEAPEVRLNRWRFAAASDGRVAVHGEPIPSLPGQQFWVTHGVALPVGWCCEPVIDGAVLADRVGVQEGELVLWHTTGEIERLSGEAFVHASRSAVRSTVKALGHDA